MSACRQKISPVDHSSDMEGRAVTRNWGVYRKGTVSRDEARPSAHGLSKSLKKRGCEAVRLASVLHLGEAFLKQGQVLEVRNGELVSERNEPWPDVDDPEKS